MIGGLSLYSPGSFSSYGSAGFGGGQTATLGVDDGRGGICTSLECSTHGARLKELLQSKFPGLRVLGVDDGSEARPPAAPAAIPPAATRPVAVSSAGGGALASGTTLLTAQEQGGGSGGEAKQAGELSEEEKQQVAELRQIDAKVRAHERAHAAVGGQYAGAPSYEYTRGPDGQLYATSGEVAIDLGPESDPEATLQKAAQVAAAALAPADPSGQDRAVAAAAAQLRLQALAQIREEKRAETEQQEIEKAAEKAEAAERQQALQGGDAEAGADSGGTGIPAGAAPGSQTAAARASSAYAANDNAGLNRAVGQVVGISA
ncbi:putative metalloprotease CJM1_0395 family protein [Ferrovibrio sp.]|uniref:putative metalloprotease CJM1_0395 family protein n=1 Tax=Ferrovibrio sp. TaxID=1917215 RepID=UPI003513BBA2